MLCQVRSCRANLHGWGGNGAGTGKWMLTKIIAAALQRDAGGAGHRQVSEQPTGAMNDMNDVND